MSLYSVIKPSTVRASSPNVGPRGMHPDLIMGFDFFASLREMVTGVRWNLTRSGELARQMKDGTFLTAPADHPAIGKHGLFHDGVSTNSLLNNRDLSAGDWTDNLSSKSQDQVGIDGQENKAWTCVDTSDTEKVSFLQEISVSDDESTHVQSFFIRKEDDETTFPLLNCVFVGGTLLAEQILLNKKTGEVKELENDGIYYVKNHGQYWGIELSLTNNNSGNTIFRFEIYVAYNSDFSTSSDASATGSIVYDFGQVELNASFTTSPIETGDSPVSRATQAADAAGNGLSIPLNDLDPRIMKALRGGGDVLSFDGVDDYVKSNNTIGLTGTASKTLEFWSKLETLSLSDHQVSAAFGDLDTSGSFGFFYNYDTGTMWFFGNTDDLDSGISYTNSWEHWCVTYDGSTVKIYKGSTKVKEGDKTLDTGDNNFFLGSKQNLNNYFAGQLSDVRVWDYVRTQTEIQDNMNKRLNGDETGLITYYKLDEGTGTTATDSAGDNNGAIEGASWAKGSPFHLAKGTIIQTWQLEFDYDRTPLGPEMVTDGDCSTDSFTKGTGWTYDSTNLEYDCDASQTTDSDLTQSAGISTDITYTVTFEVKNYVAGSVTPVVGGDTVGTARTANGVYTEELTAASSPTDDKIYLQADLDFDGSIDNVSVKKTYIEQGLVGFNDEKNSGIYIKGNGDILVSDGINTISNAVQWSNGDNIDIATTYESDTLTLHTRTNNGSWTTNTGNFSGQLPYTDTLRPSFDLEVPCSFGSLKQYNKVLNLDEIEREIRK